MYVTARRFAKAVSEEGSTRQPESESVVWAGNPDKVSLWCRGGWRWEKPGKNLLGAPWMQNLCDNTDAMR